MIAQFRIAAMNTLGSLISRARERAGYTTQKALAEAWPRERSFVSNLENDKVKETLSPADMHRLRDLLGIRVSDLLTASGYDLEDASAGESNPDVAELAEHARLVDWHADPSRLPVIHAIFETWSRFDRDSFRLIAEDGPNDNGDAP